MALVRRALPPVLTLCVLLVVWQTTVDVFDVEPYILPAPSKIWTAFTEVRGTLPGNIYTTLVEAVLGLALGAAAGALVAATLWSSTVVRRAFYPILVVTQTVPMVVLAPLLVLWFGLGLFPKVVVVALTTFFPVAVATTQGLLHADRDLIDLVRTMRARWWHVARYVLIPSAAPSFFSGLRIGASYAVAAAVIGEWVGASSGLGLLVTRAQSSFRIDRVFVAVLIIAALSILLFAIVDGLSRVAMPWQRSLQKEET